MDTVVSARSSTTAPRPTWAQSMWLFFERAFQLRGRASRPEYWWWMGTNILVLLLLRIVIPMASGAEPDAPLQVGPFGSILFADLAVYDTVANTGVHTIVGDVCAWLTATWVVATLIPSITVLVRRLHDSNLSGWWAWLAPIPMGQLVLLFLAGRRSRPAMTAAQNR